MFEKAKPWLILGVSAWALLAFVAWQYESTCGMFLSGECLSKYWDGTRWILLLKWVEKYQSLLAGLAAVVGGAFVVLSARINSDAAQKETDRAQRRASSIACSLIHDEFRDAAMALNNTPYGTYLYNDAETKVRPDNIFKHLPSHLHQLHYVSPSLGSMVSAAKREFDALCISDLRKVSPDKRSHSLMQCYVMIQLLLEVERSLKPDGTFPIGEKKVPAGYLIDQLKRRNLSPEQLIGYYSLFDWEAKSANQSS